MTYYELLDVAQNCDFPALRKAYYKKARECHPDLFAGSPEKTEEFKRLVEAFNILSDPERRYAYDQRIRAPVTVFRVQSETIMDTDSDDTLEELIVAIWNGLSFSSPGGRHATIFRNDASKPPHVFFKNS